MLVAGNDVMVAGQAKLDPASLTQDNGRNAPNNNEHRADGTGAMQWL
jgi:hypothetical protein